MAPQTELCNIVCLLICQITTLLKSEQRSPLRNFDKKWQFKDHVAGNDGLGGGDDDGGFGGDDDGGLGGDDDGSLGGDDDGGGCGRVAC